MWFEKAMYKEKIKFMFNNELSIDDSILETFLYHTDSMLRISFHSDKLPKIFPEKWKKNEFNALKIILTFGGVKILEYQGGKIGIRCSPIIESEKEKIILSIKNNEFSIYCVANFMVIDDIIPYLDQRWIK
ncbi:Imm50 family immunity protein [Photorhabdus khanii]|nr:Imm50 family immunity protein [Photorhabdus khanii]